MTSCQGKAESCISFSTLIKVDGSPRTGLRGDLLLVLRPSCAFSALTHASNCSFLQKFKQRRPLKGKVLWFACRSTQPQLCLASKPVIKPLYCFSHVCCPSISSPTFLLLNPAILSHPPQSPQHTQLHCLLLSWPSLLWPSMNYFLITVNISLFSFGL